MVSAGAVSCAARGPIGPAAPGAVPQCISTKPQPRRIRTNPNLRAAKPIRPAQQGLPMRTNEPDSPCPNERDTRSGLHDACARTNPGGCKIRNRPDTRSGPRHRRARTNSGPRAIRTNPKLVASERTQPSAHPNEPETRSIPGRFWLARARTNPGHARATAGGGATGGQWPRAARRARRELRPARLRRSARRDA